ncbi:hypothetical protein D8780_00060 [Notoacmeibacter ruber]|uniref:Uncharacterized protein n=2 Tax=Notoacmeibacter ruber TaxID=2670375 RepID=A0A3L7J840_9HYPH|nr:hypothetical protein D8780_00060 [Notoacmeibacter ruber]
MIAAMAFGVSSGAAWAAQCNDADVERLVLNILEENWLNTQNQRVQRFAAFPAIYGGELVFDFSLSGIRDRGYDDQSILQCAATYSGSMDLVGSDNPEGKEIIGLVGFSNLSGEVVYSVETTLDDQLYVNARW